LYQFHSPLFSFSFSLTKTVQALAPPGSAGATGLIKEQLRMIISVSVTGQYTGFDSAHTLKKQENYRQQKCKRFGSFGHGE